MPQANVLNAFARSVNGDGTADSVCLFCFATVGAVLTERELEEREAAHFCSQRKVPPARFLPKFAP